MSARKGILKGFNSSNYTATVQLAGSLKVYLDDVRVARNISSGEMTVGRKAVVVFFDVHNSKEAVVVGVYT